MNAAQQMMTFFRRPKALGNRPASDAPPEEASRQNFIRDEIAEIVRRISLKGFSFEVYDILDVTYLRAWTVRPGDEWIGTETFESIRLVCETNVETNDADVIVKEAMRAAAGAVIHEIEEQFLFDGVQWHSPHGPDGAKFGVFTRAEDGFAARLPAERL